MNVFLYVALALLIALFSTRVMKLIKMPNVTGYLLTGILIGPFVLGLFFNNFDFMNAGDTLSNPIAKFISDISWISDVALGFIAFSIGGSFRLSTLKKVGSRIIVITILEALGAAVMVFLGLLIAHFIWPTQVPFDLVLTLSAISCATAPAATLMVIRQYQAKGPVVSTLLPVVALDDAVALIMFAILFATAKSIATGSEFSLYEMLAKPLIEIVLSIVIGGVLGFVISMACKLFKSRNNRLIWSLFSVLCALGLYQLFRQSFMGGFELSSLLMCMMSGALFVNLRKDAMPTFEVIDRFTAPVFLLFFVLSGASLNLSIFASENAPFVIIIALFYLVFRVVGKWGGAFSGAKLTKSEPAVQKYLGFTLIPQAGVAIGLATTAGRVLSTTTTDTVTGSVIVAVILTSTLIYELTGPMITKIALTKAGEITLAKA
ncbi:MAG: cation:proton antiporter [Bacilli bacterium]|nr:cation:proton antiporter [Bacilli bacterium]